MRKEEKRELRQQIACEWLEQNYLQYDSLRHDMVTDRLQVRCAHSLEDAASGYSLEFRGEEMWRNLTDKDINTMVCQCVQESGVNISVSEMWTALKSDLITAVHPIRSWLNHLPEYTPEQPDWIDIVAQQVRVRDSAQNGVELSSPEKNNTTQHYTTLPNTTPHFISYIPTFLHKKKS